MKFQRGQLVKRDTGKFFFQGEIIGFYWLADRRFGYVLQNGTNVFMALEEDLEDAEPKSSEESLP
jgi:hypothetical protein